MLPAMLHRPFRRKERPALCLFFFLVLFYYFTNAGGYKKGDESFMISMARQIAIRGQIGFAMERPPNGPYFDGYCARGPNGLYYYKWGLGQSLVEVPFVLTNHLIWRSVLPANRLHRPPSAYYTSEFMLLILCPSIISALGCVLIFLFASRLGHSQRVSLLLSLIYGLGTMIWPYSKSLMAEATLTVTVLAGVYAAFRYGAERRGYWLAISGACMGFAVLTKVMAVVLIPILVVYVLAKTRSREGLRDLCLYFGPPLLVFLGIQAWHNLIRYGSPWQFGYHQGWGALGFCTPLYVGLWGLLASPGKSYFLYSPVALLGLISARRFFERCKGEALLFGALAVVWLVPHAMWCLWAGDWAWGPRFLLVITPYLILPAGVLFEGWTRQRQLVRRFATSVIALSFAVQILGVSVHPFEFFETRREVVKRLMNPQIPYHTYSWTTSENAFNNFTPIFSHIVGNWWLFKHMVFSYDLASDAPWKALGSFSLGRDMKMDSRRIVPFWWPVSFPARSRSSRSWAYPLAALNLAMLFWWGFRLSRFFRRGHESVEAGPSQKVRPSKPKRVS